MIGRKKQRQILSLVPLAAVVLCGCQAYHPVPLDDAAVEHAMRTPEAALLRVQAAEIRHPILRPVKLNPKQGLSPDEAAVLAVLLNPSLRAARDQRSLADAQMFQAGLLPNPELGYSFEVPAGGDTAGTVNAFGIELSWDATSLITRAAKRDKAQAHQAAIEMGVAWQEWQAAQAAKSAVYQLVTLKRQADLAKQVEQQASRNVDLVRKAVRRGARTSKDLAAAQATSRKAHQAAIQLDKQVEQQRLRLNSLLGLPGTTAVTLMPDIRLRSQFKLAGADALLAGLEKRRLDLIALRRGYESQEAAVRSAILRQFPRISIGPTMGRDIENVDTAGFALSIEMPIFDRNQGAIAIERATRRQLFDEYVSRVFQARADVEMVVARIRYLNKQIAAAAAAEPDLRKLVDEYRKALAEGRVDALTYYGAWNDLTANRMELLNLKGQLAQAVVALELAAGMYEIPQGSAITTTEPAQSTEVRP